MTEGERLGWIVDTLCAGNQSLFARRTGIGKTAINKIINGRGEEIGLHLSKTYIRRICNAFPSVNPKFLSGEEEYPGDITPELSTSRLKMELEARDKIIDDLRKELALQRRIIERLLAGDPEKRP